ncbi:zinc finger, CCHC-type containing protein [Tanacetum coccineum]
MAAVAMKHMASNFVKLDKFEEVDFRRLQKKMHFLLSASPEFLDALGDSVKRCLSKSLLSGSTGTTVKDRNELWDSLEAKYMAEDASSKKFLEELTLVEFGSHMHIEESLKVQDSDKLKSNNIVGPSVFNMVEYNNSIRYNDNKGKRKHKDTKSDPNKKSKVTCWKCGKLGHLKKDCKGGKVGNKANGSGTNGLVNGSSNSLKAFMSSSKLNDLILWHVRLGHVHFKRMQDMSKDGLIPALDMNTEKCKTCMLTKITKKPFQNVKCKTKVLELIHSDMCDLHATLSLGNKKSFMTFIDDASRFCYAYLLHSKDGALDKFKVFKTEVKLQQRSLINKFKSDRGGLSQEFWGEAMEVVRLPDPKLKNLGERGIECIFVGYVEHSKAFRPSQRSLISGTEDISGSVVPEKVTKEVVIQQPKPELRKSKRNRTPKNFRPEFQLYLIEETRGEDVAFWKETINDEIDIIGNNTWVLADIPLGCKWIFKKKLKVDGTIEKFKARLVI